MKTIISISLVFASLCFIQSSYATAPRDSGHSDGTDSRCPEQIDTSQSLATPISGFQSFDNLNSLHFLESIEFYDGAPPEGRPLAPDNAKSSGTLKNALWTFSKQGDRKNNNIYQVCHYNSTRISLSNALPPGLRSCQVVFAKKPAQKVSVMCQ